MKILQNLWLLAPLAIVVTAGPVTAVSLDDLVTCYTKDYSTHEIDTVKNIERLSLAVDASGLTVTLTGINRLKQFGYLQFSCYEQSGSNTVDPICGTFELESSISITKRANGDIIILTTNAFLSDIGGDYWYEDPNEGEDHFIFNLEGDDPQGYGPIGAGPRNYSVLSPSNPSNCPVIGND